MSALLSQLGLFTAYAVIGGSSALVLAMALERTIPLSAGMRKWMYLAVLSLPLVIYGIHAATPCQISPDRVLPALCRLTGPYAFLIGLATFATLLVSMFTLQFSRPRVREWNNARAREQVEGLLQGQSFTLIDSEYPQAFVRGWFSPVICVTRGLHDILDAGELDAVLRHEAAHVKNGDNLLNFLAVVFSRLACLSPAAQMALRRFECARETAADEAVSNGLDLASALVKVCRRGIELHSSLNSCLSGSSVAGRIEGLLVSRQRGNPRWFHYVMLSSLLVVLLIC
jgi:Zn-dependent protease with chaperone function